MWHSVLFVQHNNLLKMRPKSTKWNWARASEREREEDRGKKEDNAAAHYLLQVTCVIFVLFVIIINMGMCLWATHVSQFSQLERSRDGERKTHQIALCSHYFNWISPSQHDATMRKMMNFQPTSRLMMKWMAFFIVFSGSASLLCATQWIKIATGLTLDWVWISDNKTCLMHSLSLFGILFSWINTYRRVICYL